MTALNDGFDQPNTTIAAADLAFPARGADPEFLPPFDLIPAAFESRADWDLFHRTWFHRGLPETVELYPRDGVDPEHAWNHLRVVQGSFASKHEHKMAALSWLASRWFEGFRL